MDIKLSFKTLLAGLFSALCFFMNIAYAETVYQAMVKEGDVLLSVNNEKAKLYKRGDEIKLGADDLICLKSDKGIVEITGDNKHFKELISAESLCQITPAEKGLKGWFSKNKKTVKASDDKTKMPVSQMTISVLELDGEEFYVLENSSWHKNRHTLPFTLQVLSDDKGEILKRYISGQKQTTLFFIPRKDIESGNAKKQSLRLNVINKSGFSLTDDFRVSLNNSSSEMNNQLVDINKTLEYQLKTLELQKKQLDKMTPEVANTYADISLTYLAMGDLSSALGFEQKALKIRQKLLGKEHPATVQSYLALGEIYTRLNNPVEAEKYKKIANKILEKTLGSRSRLTKTTPEHSKIFYEKDSHTLVDILYGTDREKNPDLSNSKNMREDYFTGGRGDLRFGVAQVSIPKTHKMGAVERPSWYTSEKIGEHVIITDLNELDKNAFREIFNDKLKGVKENDILVFIHGFNVTFANALRRTAQLTYDLKFKGVPLTYSWPSQGDTTEYFMDEASIQYTVPHLVAFLTEVVESNEKSPNKANIHIIGHSMGSRALSYAVKELSFVYKGKKIFENIIFAAPDFDKDVFKVSVFPYVRKTTNKITLYASSEDTALFSSELIHGAKRLGQGGEDVFVFEGLDTIDATGIDPDYFSLSHSYFSEKKLLVNDLKEVIFKSLPPQKRDHLVKKLKQSLAYWRFNLGG